MLKSAGIGLLYALSFLAGQVFVYAQELGAIQSFGPEGRLYSTDRYLLYRQPYSTEDSSGYEGQFRIVKWYDGGGYEVETFDYIARCNAIDGNSVIMTFRPGKHDEPLASVRVDTRKQPAAALKNAFNLFWAACYGQFRKFK